MGIYTDYEEATRDRGRAQPGNVALMDWYLARYSGRKSPAPANLGIYVGKRLGDGWSVHAEGRASDLGTKPYAKPGWGWGLADELRLNSKELGIQLIIFDDKIWSGNYPYAGWREYGGSEPHTGHLHVELSWKSARELTQNRLAEVLGGPTHPAKPTQPATDWTEELIMTLPTLEQGDRGAHVGRLQSLLASNGFPPRKSFNSRAEPDEEFGDGTGDSLEAFQEARKVRHSVVNGKGDRKCGRWTWAALLGQD